MEHGGNKKNSINSYEDYSLIKLKDDAGGKMFMIKMEIQNKLKIAVILI